MFIKFQIVVCKLFQFGRVKKIVIWERDNGLVKYWLKNKKKSRKHGFVNCRRLITDTAKKTLNKQTVAITKHQSSESKSAEPEIEPATSQFLSPARHGLSFQASACDLLKQMFSYLSLETYS